MQVCSGSHVCVCIWLQGALLRLDKWGQAKVDKLMGVLESARTGAQFMACLQSRRVGISSVLVSVLALACAAAGGWF